MSVDTTTPVRRGAGPTGLGGLLGRGDDVQAPARRRAQIALGLVWLLDAGLQYQPYMFTKEFPNGVIQPTISGNPSVIKDPMTWSLHTMQHHIVLLNAIFATIQLALAVLILNRRTIKLGLAASIPWSIAVWWLGEGLGGILQSPTPSPFMGLPGAVIIYAFIALLVWPRAVEGQASVATASPIGKWANLGWAGMWGSFVYALLEGSNRAPKALGQMVDGMGDGEPGWLKSFDHWLGQGLSGNGAAVSIVFAILCLSIAVAVFLPAPVTRAAVVIAVGVALCFWVTEDFGAVLTGKGTDPNSGLLIAFLALVFWPRRSFDQVATIKEVS